MESTISAAPQISIDREKTLRSHRRYWVLRRAQDIVFSLLALILLAPLALLISPLPSCWTAPETELFSGSGG